MKQCVYYNIVRLVMGDVVHLMAQHQSRTSQHVKQQELIMDIKIKYLLGALLPLFVHNLTYIPEVYYISFLSNLRKIVEHFNGALFWRGRQRITHFGFLCVFSFFNSRMLKVKLLYFLLLLL